MTVDVSNLTYNPETGIVSRLVSEPHRPCGPLKRRLHGGYLITNIKGKRYLIHRLAWFIHTGRWPEYVDHINGDRSDNRWENLREVTKEQNLRNCAKRTDNKSGQIGVSWSKAAQKWEARIKGRYLGLFDTVEDAVDAREATPEFTDFHTNHGRNAI